MFSLRFGAVQRFGAFKCGRNFREMKTSIFYRVHSLLIITKAQKQLLLPPGRLHASTLPLPHASALLLLLHGATCLPLCWGNTGCTRYSILHFTTNACLTIFSWRAKISHVPPSLTLSSSPSYWARDMSVEGRGSGVQLVHCAYHLHSLAF